MQCLANGSYAVKRINSANKDASAEVKIDTKRLKSKKNGKNHLQTKSKSKKKQVIEKEDEKIKGSLKKRKPQIQSKKLTKKLK